MHTGSCLCGAVKYEIRGELGPAFYCHCSRCRKASGSAFASNVVVSAKDFVIVQGEGSLRSFSSSEGMHRTFCSNCGSPIMSRRENFPQVRVRLGTLDTPLSEGPGAHIFVASKADWFEIHDALPQYSERPQG
ncbi:MAG: GFA family protein [Betaproteobacteria bacterium]|nr:GFA family protein [Betaproteobacteria bacterium]